MTYAPLHVHSHYSFYRSLLTVEEIVRGAAGMGLPAAALTDSNLAGLIPFVRACSDHSIQPIPGLCLDCRAILFAMNQEGYRTLNQISTARQIYGGNDLPSLIGTAPGCMVLVHDPALLPPLHRMVSRDRLRVELRPASSRNIELRRIASSLHLSCCATPLVRRDSPTGESIRHLRLLEAIGNATTVGKLPPLGHEERWHFLFTPSRMERFFPPEELQTTLDVAGASSWLPRLDQRYFPRFPGCSPEDTPGLLRELCRGKVPHLYPDVAARKRAFQRLDHELSVILRLGFTDYFLVVWDVVRQAREWGYPCLGRGSAAASIVSYCLGITPVDPIRYDLYFERFLNPERTSPPDIDVDFGTSRRDRILRYIYDSYGEERVAMISTITRFAGRGALREAGKALGYSDRELSSLCRRLPHVRAGNLRESLEKRPECRRLPFRDEPFRTLIPLAERLAETPRGWGIHCGGVVITPDPLTHHLALTRSANGLIITQPDMGPVEAMGLMKLDILGNRSLDVLPDTLAQLKGEGVGPIDLTLATVSNNSATKSLIREGRTIGCFYIESPGMRQLLRKLRVEDFPALTAASSIIRPGVAESGMMAAYISRHHDPASVTYLHPRLSELLGETHGIMVYQEDVIRVVHDLAGMTLGEADLFRRAMSGKLRSREAMEATRALFLERCRAQGLDRSVTEELYRQIASFAGYSFCKAHSAAFATLSFQVAYLKAHYPAEFLAAVLSNGGGFYPPLAYISEARRLGLTLLPPDINRARVHYVGNGTTLRVGLSCVKGVGNELARRIVHERDKGGAFLSLHDFLRRTRADRDAVISLINAGGCSYLNPDPRVLHWHLRLSRNGQHTEAFPLPADIPAFPPETSLERARREWDALGYTLEAHPMALIGRPAGCLPAAELSSHAGQRVRVAGILITAKRTRVKKSGEGMAFLDMEDESDTFAATLFPRVYREYAHLLDGRGPYLVCGRVEEDHGALSVTTEQLFRIDQRGIRRSGSGRAEKRGNGDGRVSA